MTCNKNEQQQDAKNSAELQTKWTKTTWKTFGETVWRGHNRSLKASLFTYDGDDDDDDDDDDNDDNDNFIKFLLEVKACLSFVLVIRTLTVTASLPHGSRS